MWFFLSFAASLSVTAKISLQKYVHHYSIDPIATPPPSPPKRPQLHSVHLLCLHALHTLGIPFRRLLH